MCGRYAFTADEVLVYRGYEGHSHYDDSHEFRSDSEGLTKCWLVSRQRPESWDQYFEPLQP